ncbi:DUF4919 domain-containing protein [Chryseobacterium sp. JUb7]|uniref:DUF4919 domain-containing protein n=1 Tax=Chryseobacterium sp. JUb7 TaxID=2940599 RepID=UPI002168BA36|nr:DUF4919 domain-containing protein [Chryseobacterium sp. JUb7]MCS3529996.1 hypothetical protein [Chryseobacterium sp. JUb7]
MSQETVFDFIKDPTKENFLKSRELIVTNPDYNPYSDDLEIMEQLFENKEYEKLNYYVNINVLLSPRAHFIKYFSLKQAGNTKAADSVMFICHNILSGIEKTGDGTLQNPYIVIRISDEADFLQLHLRKKYTQQKLMQNEGKYLDVLTLEDGSELYFDITDAYQRISFSSKKRNETAENKEEKPEKKKWWKF